MWILSGFPRSSRYIRKPSCNPGKVRIGATNSEAGNAHLNEVRLSSCQLALQHQQRATAVGNASIDSRLLGTDVGLVDVEDSCIGVGTVLVGDNGCIGLLKGWWESWWPHP